MKPATHRPRVLVVDDQTVNVRTLASLLAPEVEALFATDGASALAKARQLVPDLVLLDVDMPGLSGYEVCRLLKSDPSTADIPVVFVTGLSQAEDEEKGLSLGAIDYITKPFQPAIVKARVRNHLELKRSRDALVESYRRLSAAQASLVEAEKMASLGQLVAGLAHEINTPIGVALTAASHLGSKAGELAGRFRAARMTRGDLEVFLTLLGESAALILSSLDRSASLVSRFKQLAAEQAADTLAEVDLARHLTEAVRLWEAADPRRSLTLVVEAPAGIRLETFPAALTRLVHALLDNVRAHAFPDGGPAEARLTATPRPDGGARVEVSDRGAGMPAETLLKALDPFFTTRRGDGFAGLGLTIAYNLAASTLRGRIAVDSEPGRGTVVGLDLPARVTACSP